MDYHGMLGEVEKKKPLSWCVSQLFLKYPPQRASSHHDHWPTPTAGQESSFASRIFKIQRRFWDHSAGSVSACGLKLPGAHRESRDAQTSSLSPTIRHWWVGREGRWMEGQAEKIGAVAHLDPAPLWRVLLGMPSP